MRLRSPVGLIPRKAASREGPGGNGGAVILRALPHRAGSFR